MITVEELLHRQRKYTLYMLSLFVLGFGLSKYQAVFLGLIIGVIISFISLLLNKRRTDKLIQKTLGDNQNNKSISFKNLGITTTVAILLLIILLANRYHIDVSGWAIALGLMAGHTVLIIDYTYHIFVARKGGE